MSSIAAAAGESLGVDPIARRSPGEHRADPISTGQQSVLIASSSPAVVGDREKWSCSG